MPAVQDRDREKIEKAKTERDDHDKIESVDQRTAVNGKIEDSSDADRPAEMTRLDRGVPLRESDFVPETYAETAQRFDSHIDHMGELLPRRRMRQISIFDPDRAETDQFRSHGK